ncbi:Non-specific serine/threonine protein kinase, partial [Bertholletia excelsa]
GEPNCPASSSVATTDQHCDYNELKLKAVLYKMIWDFGLACFLPSRKKQMETEKTSNNPEHNKAWLLAESGGCGAELTSAEPQSVHSSFRFSFCSQVELESMNVAANPSSATVLMVNLDTGLTDSRSKELKWRRIESLERFFQRYSIWDSFVVLYFVNHTFIIYQMVGFLRTAVAIKRLDKEDKESPKAFCRELMIASSLHNPNIEGLFLVYRYVSGGSLERYLHEEEGSERRSITSLPVRYKVAVGIAEAMGICTMERRDVLFIETLNLLISLSSKKTPKLCDFGLATWTPAPSVPFLCKTVKGTFGYLAPEYFQHGKVSDKPIGRKPIEAKRGPGEENLVLWAKPLLQQGTIERLLDPRLKFNTKNSNQISLMAQAAAACINSEESRRPPIDEIIAILRGEEPNCPNRRKSSLSSSGCVLDFG